MSKKSLLSIVFFFILMDYLVWFGCGRSNHRSRWPVPAFQPLRKTGEEYMVPPRVISQSRVVVRL